MFGQFTVLKSNHFFTVTDTNYKCVLMQYLHLKREVPFPVEKLKGRGLHNFLKKPSPHFCLSLFASS